MRNTCLEPGENSMLQSFFSSKTRLKLLRLFVNNPTRQYYLREISKLLDEPLTPIRRELLNLKKVGFLKRSRVANLVYYDVNRDFLLFHEFKSMIEKSDSCRWHSRSEKNIVPDAAGEEMPASGSDLSGDE